MSNKLSPKTPKKTFLIQAKLDVLTTVEVVASSLQEAVDVSKTMSAADFISIAGDELDTSLEITGAYKA